MAESNDILIDVKNISKSYRIWNSPAARLNSAACDCIASILPAALPIKQRLQSRSRESCKDFPALKDINIQIHQGESVAIVGRNGSGKSTLLQIIAGTTRASSGEVMVDGKIAALLELGSAFHPQFTGRDNVYLNCAIIGLDKRETDDLFDDIAGFADIGEFMEQPVRTYSSGMATRLAFSVQAVLQPDILIIDEALAVGDTYFQSRCYRRIREMLDEGVTLLFVSHSADIVRELCTRAILLNEGELVIDDSPSTVLDRYFQMDVALKNKGRGTNAIPAVENKHEKTTAVSGKVNKLVATDIEPDLMQGQELFLQKANENRVCDERARFLNIQLLDSSDNLQQAFSYGTRVTLRMLVQFNEDVKQPMIAYQVLTLTGVRLVHVDTRYMENTPEYYQAGECYLFEWQFNLNLQHGQYYLRAVLSLPPRMEKNEWDYIDVVPHGYDFSVSAHPAGMLGALTSWDSDLAIHQLDMKQND